ITLIFIFALYLSSIAYVNAAQIIDKEQILFSGQNLDIGFMGYRYSGPYYVESDKTIYVEWAADRLVSVYILNEVEWRNWPKYGGPSSYRVMKTAQSGRVQFVARFSDNFYVVVMGFAGSAARLYSWTEKLVWRERIAGSLRIIVKDTYGSAVNAAYVSISGPESRGGYTDSTGQITFSDLAPGQYTIVSSKANFQTASITATVQQDKMSQVNITMQQISSSTPPTPTTSPSPQPKDVNIEPLSYTLLLIVLIIAFVATFILIKTR
ncbi:MAG: carboxypeptidase-like regulatory domain-containing protein, partial [Candidatus Bathyarchaeia archaeon]